MKEKNKGYTLVELVVVVSIMAILLTIIVPNVSIIWSFRAKRAANSIAAALDKTKVEAMNRRGGEMKLEKRSDGYYITYYLDRGKRAADISEEDSEQIGPSRLRISYTTDSEDGVVHELQEGEFLILTYDRDTGAFRQIQSNVVTQSQVNEYLKNNQDIAFPDTGHYCKSIIVSGGARSRVITLIKDTGKYQMS